MPSEQVQAAHSMTNCRRRTRLLPSCLDGRKEFIFILIIFASVDIASSGVPRFFESNRMAVLLLPGDTEVDSIIYRLRAEDTDRNYPLVFEIRGPIGINLIYIEPHECTASNDIFCEADVYLRSPLEVGRLYIFNLTVTDQRGFNTEVTARVDATNGRLTPSSVIFVRFSPTIEIREDMPPKSIISQMTVRKRQRSTFGEFQVLGPAQALFRMQPANLVSTQAINGTLILEGKVDFEVANLHTFKVCILQPFTDEIIDTRNIACVLVSVVVLDVQDEPPVFIKAPPVTRVPAAAVAGDEIATVWAKDGDRGIPRPIRYSILPETSIYTKYFRINSKSGVITMNETALKLRERMISLDPILMTVTAEEVTSRPDNYPALSSSVEIAFVILDSEFLNPKFVHEHYIGEIFEDAVPDTEVRFTSSFLVKDVKGLFTLEIQGDNGAFSVSPSVVKDASEISIRVKNSFLLDFEKTPQIAFKLIARQVQGRTQASSSTAVTVRILDINDNPPIFSEEIYEVEMYENAVRGTSIVRVYASDKDTGTFGVIRYTDLFGPGAGSLQLEPTTGLVRCMTDNHSFDREIAAEFILTVEAKDNNGQGSGVNTATAKIIIRVKDVNDSPPRFVESIYKGVMAPDLQRLRDPIRIKAVDADAERPNNEIIYDIVRSSYSGYFSIDRRTGLLDVAQNFYPRNTIPLAGLNSKHNQIKSRIERALHENDTVISLRVKASDLGDPPLSDWVDVKIFKQEYGERVIRFIYPKPPSEVRNNRRELETTLNLLTGASTEILRVDPLKKGLLGEQIDPTKSDVTALVKFGLTTVIDVERLTRTLNNSQIQRCMSVTKENAVVITSLEGQNSSYIVGVVFLCIILAIVILVIFLCCCCEGCPLFRNNKSNMISDEGSEGVSYVRVDENGKYRGSSEDIGWWMAMPYCLKEVFLACGYTPSGGRRSRLAWSAGERQQYGNVAQPPDRGVVEDRAGMIQAMHRPRDALHLEDLDAGRMNRQQITNRQPPRVESRTSHNSNEQQPRRVFVLKDAMGIARGEEDLRQGNTYLLEDLEDDGRRNVQYDDDLMYQQGNSQVLRLHANPHDAAFNEQRPGGRVGVMTEGSVIDEGSGGHVNRFVSGQPNAKYYDSPSHIKLRGITDDEQSNGLSSNRSSFKDKVKSKLGLTHQHHHPEGHLVDRATEPFDSNSKSARSNNIPGTYGFQHTKTSILRYESTKAKIDEVREDLIRQGKDPDDLCLQHQGGSLGESRKGSVRESRTSNRHDHHHKGRHTIPGGESRISVERRNSLPDVETNLEREAAMRHTRKTSEGGPEYREEEQNKGEIDYERETEKTEEIERRQQIRRSEATKALSEELLLDPNQIALQQQLFMQQMPSHQLQQTHLMQQQLLLQQQQLQLQSQIQQMQQRDPNSLLMQTVIPSSRPSSLVPHVEVAEVHRNDGEPAPPLRIANNVVPTISVPTAAAPEVTAHTAPATTIAAQTVTATTSTAPTVVEPAVAVPTVAASANINPIAVAPSEIPKDSADSFVTENSIISKGVTKEAIQMAIAAAAIDTNTINDQITNKQSTVKFNDKVVTIDNSNSEVTNLNVSTSVRETMQENIIASNQNLPDDAKIQSSETVSANEEVNKRIQDERNVNITNSTTTITEKNIKHDKSVLNIPSNKRKKNKMLEKKSVFTIAYDGMKTDQLRPDSASAEQ